MKTVQGLTSTFGEPAALMKQLASDPAILEQDTAPQQLYTHIVWAAGQIYNQATTFNQTLGAFEQLLNPANCGSPSACAEVLKTVLTGPGGLQSTAQQAEQTANDLIKSLAAFDQSLVEPNKELQQYTAKDGQFYQDAVNAAGQDAADVQTFQDDADTAYKLWRDLTISATTVSVGLTVLSCGALLPLAAVAAGVLGSQAQKARDSYDSYIRQRDQASDDERKKQQLIVDLGGFNSQLLEVSTACKNFITVLEQVSGAWAKIGADLAFIANNFTPEKLGSLSWVMQALKCNQATQDWQTIATEASNYTTNSLVSFDFSANFGQPLPASASGP